MGLFDRPTRSTPKSYINSPYKNTEIASVVVLLAVITTATKVEILHFAKKNRKLQQKENSEKIKGSARIGNAIATHAKVRSRK